MMIGKYDEKQSFDYENGFLLTSDTYRMGNILAHYELYKKICNLPGNVVELGVFKGSSIIQWATFRELLENENSRKIIGFDTFGMFPNEKGNVNSDKDFIKMWNDKFQDEFIDEKEIAKSLEHKKISNFEFVKGDIGVTLPDYLAKNKQMKIALLHLDLDVYQPTAIGLQLLYDLVVPNGIIIFDDYGTIEGATKAIDEFFKDKKVVFNKFSFSHGKPSYIVKPW